jgi:hypothetical protein
MDALAHCKAMEAFCLQRARMEGEVAGFWLAEAESWRDRLFDLAEKAKRSRRPVIKAPPQSRRAVS